MWNTGHEDNCNEQIVAKRVEDGLAKRYRVCPICDIPFKNVIEHIQLQHHRTDEEVDKYRLIAERGNTAVEKVENRRKLKAARQKVILSNQQLDNLYNCS